MQNLKLVKFKQAGKKKEVIKQGVGLGLAISKEIVESHNGKIWVESELNNGTAFNFTLPKGNGELNKSVKII